MLAENSQETLQCEEQEKQEKQLSISDRLVAAKNAQQILNILWGLDMFKAYYQRHNDIDSIHMVDEQMKKLQEEFHIEIERANKKIAENVKACFITTGMGERMKYFESTLEDGGHFVFLDSKESTPPIIKLSGFPGLFPVPVNNIKSIEQIY